MEYPKCECCGEKAVKAVHSFADGTTTDHYYCEQHEDSQTKERNMKGF